MSSEFDSLVKNVADWHDQVSHVPALARDHIIKSRLKPEDVKRGFQSHFFDPLSVQYSMGYKDRKFSLTYEVLKRIPQQLSIIAAIIQTRCNQVASFSVPYRTSKSVGFTVKHKDPSHATTKGELEFIKDLERFIYNCGHSKPNPHSDIKRDDFESFLKKIVRDSLLFDQVTVEVVPDRRGIPYEFMAVDASTIRIAADKVNGLSPGPSFHSREDYYSSSYKNQLRYEFGPYKALKMFDNKSKYDFVQVINGQIQNAFTRDELIFGVRNPRSDIYVQGYGYGELEQLITIITSHLYAEAYNRNFFVNSAAPKGILNFKGDMADGGQLEAFRREWRASLEGTANSWKTPILQAEQGIDWIDLHPSNREMEYGQWVEYLLKITCFTENTPITIANGSTKPISQVIPGELVYTHTGKLKPVKNLQISDYSGDLYHIKAGETIEVTPEHPIWVTQDPNKPPAWVEAQDICVGDYLVVSYDGTFDHLLHPSVDRSTVVVADQYVLVPVTDVYVAHFTGKVYNIEVEDEHTYQAHRFAVHNCAVFLIDPAELNFDMHGGQQQTPLFESSQEWKLKASRDRGLKPMLRFIAKLINENIISKIDDHFVFDFIGLEELTEQEKHTLRTEQVSSYLTLNEVRKEDDLPELPYGDMPMNPTYLQAIQVKMAQEQAKQQMSQGAGGAGEAPQQQQEAPGDEKDPNADSYSDSFGKSLSIRSQDKYLEIDLSDLDLWKASLK